MATKKKSTKKKKLVSTAERRERLGQLNVLVADRDFRTASLVQRILFSFGFRNMDVTTNGESALALLRSRPYNILITEWNMVPVDGVTLVKTIRSAQTDERIPRDIPILMLTAQSDKQSVLAARDAGITEFVAKPFSARTISERIIQIIDNPRAFIVSKSYVGPDRRRRGEPPPGMEDRRSKGKPKDAEVTPAVNSFQQQLGSMSAADIINDIAVARAQAELLKAENDFIDWAKDDIIRLEKAFGDIKRNPENEEARNALLDAAYAIKSQAGIFGYPLGTEIASLLVDYVTSRRAFKSDNLIVLSKHIETIGIIFKEKMKENGQGIAKEMINSLRKLILKLG